MHLLIFVASLGVGNGLIAFSLDMDFVMRDAAVYVYVHKIVSTKQCCLSGISCF